MQEKGFIDAGKYARLYHTKPDVIIALIKRNEVPAAKIKNKWYVKKNFVLKVNPERCRLIHIANVNMLRRIELNIQSHNIRIKGTDMIVQLYQKKLIADSSLQLYFNPLSRQYLIEHENTNISDQYKNITEIVESNNLELNKQNIRDTALLFIEEYKYQHFVVYSTGVNMIKLCDTQEQALEFADRIVKKMNTGTIITVQHCGKVLKKYVMEDKKMGCADVLERAKELNEYEDIPEVKVGEECKLIDVWDGEGEQPVDSYSYLLTNHGEDGESNIDVYINYCFNIVEQKEVPDETVIRITDITLI